MPMRFKPWRDYSTGVKGSMIMPLLTGEVPLIGGSVLLDRAAGHLKRVARLNLTTIEAPAHNSLGTPRQTFAVTPIPRAVFEIG